ncbi:MAG: hypothetical protein ACFFCI_23385 [Promethearchaeota archaeon]
MNSKYRYKNKHVELILSGSHLLNKKEVWHYFYEKSSIFDPSSQEQTKIGYKKQSETVNSFIKKRREFFHLLDKSEQKYNKIHFAQAIQNFPDELKRKEELLKNYLRKFDEKEELKKLDSFGGLTIQERVRKVKNQKDAIKKEYSQVKAQLAQYRDPNLIQNKRLRQEFITSQWSSYESFFTENPEFKAEIKSLLSEYLTAELQYSAEEVNELLQDLKSNLLTLLSIKKKLINQLKIKERELRKRLFQANKDKSTFDFEEKKSQKISLYNLFAYILVQSDFKVTEDKTSLILSFNLEQYYANFFEQLSQYSKQQLKLGKKLEIDGSHFLLTDFSRSLLKQINMKLRQFNENILIYEQRGEKMGVKLNFQQIIEPFIEDFSHQLPSRLRKRVIPKISTRRAIRDRYHLKTVIPVIALIIISIIFFAVFSIPDDKRYVVQRHDSVELNYTAWVSNKSREYDVINPIVDTILWVEMIPITENDTTGLMLGLYNNLLDKNLYYESDLIWLDRCIDENRDGIDDITNKTALTYGNSSDQYFNTPLIIKFKILDIEKAPPTAQQGFVFDREEAIRLAYSIGWGIGIVGLSAFGLSVPIILFFIGKYLSEHPIIIGREDLKKAAQILLKYGILLGILISIPYIVFGFIRLHYSSGTLRAMWIKTPEELIFLITGISIPLIIVTMIMYLLIYKKIK